MLPDISSTAGTAKVTPDQATFWIGCFVAGLPIFSTQALGIHYCDPLRYSTIAFASMFGLGMIILLGSFAPTLAGGSATMPGAEAPSAGSNMGCMIIGMVMTVIGGLATVSCMFAGLGTIPHWALAETLTGRIFIEAGVAPAALDHGTIVGVDFAFIIGGAMLAGILAYMVSKVAGCCERQGFEKIE